MAEGVNVRITGKLRRFIEEQASPNGLYESASEYVRDLIRRDYQRQEERKWSWLLDQLRPGMEAHHRGSAAMAASMSSTLFGEFFFLGRSISQALRIPPAFALASASE